MRFIRSPNTWRSSLIVLGLLCLAFAAVGLPQPAHAKQGDTIKVFAAASLKNALDEAAQAFTKQSGQTISVSYAASSALAKQIEQSAPADIFISADLDWMDYLEERKLLLEGTRKNLLGNDLVLIAPASSALSLDIAPGFDLAGALAGGRLAVGSVQGVPAGKYAKAALESLKVWDSVADKLAQADNVRAALALVAQGEAPLGIVYKTDAFAEPKVKIIARFPEDTHPPIIYPAAILKEAAAPDAAKAFLAFLSTPEAGSIFSKHGFGLAKQDTPAPVQPAQPEGAGARTP